MSLWQKPENERASDPVPDAPARSASPATGSWEGRSQSQAATTTTSNVINIGQSIEIKGELTGNEDLTIDGIVEGKIVLSGHHLTIGKNGRINAEIKAKSVLVHGDVTGDVRADDKVEISTSGSVQGDLTAPRVELADGSCFKGSIDMGGARGNTGETRTTSGSATVARERELVRSASATES